MSDPGYETAWTDCGSGAFGEGYVDKPRCDFAVHHGDEVTLRPGAAAETPCCDAMAGVEEAAHPPAHPPTSSTRPESTPAAAPVVARVKRLVGRREYGMTALVETAGGPAVLKLEADGDPDAQLRNEAAVLAVLARRGVEGVPRVVACGRASVQASGCGKAFPALCLQPVGAASLASLVNEDDEAVSEQGACLLAAELLSILQEVWAAGVAVVDIAPSNIIRMPDGRHQLIDFGSAHLRGNPTPINPLQQQLFRPIRHCPMSMRYQRVDCVKPLLRPAYDLEALLYTLIFCVRGGRLPWSELDDYATSTAKQHSRKCPRFLCGGLAPIFQQFAQWVAGVDIESWDVPSDLPAWIARFAACADKRDEDDW